METFGEWLREQRGLRRLTREEFAKRVGCSVSALRKIEDGERRPSAQIAELLANCLEVPPEERPTFVRVARGELNADRLHSETVPLNRTGDFSPKLNLPVLPTPLIGRERELGQLTRLLADPECRLLTLVGPGGIGKTRLAIEVASSVQDLFADGAYFVPLGFADSTRFIVPVMAESVGFAFHHASHADPKSQLFGYLKEKGVLLLTDNLEQLLTEPGIELLAELLTHAPHVKLLATSRECLGLQDEWVFEVQGLPAPAGIDGENIAQGTSVELFVQRARRAYVGYNLTSKDYPSILRICELVDGSPLGIELAAAWVRTLSCDEIAREIEHGLDFLAVSAHGTPARHRSMRAVFDQSWKLLTEQEQQSLMHLSAFRGGFRREAAEQAAETSLAVISTLVTKSLVRRSSSGRYGLHQLIRQFAAERLAERRHAYAATQARHGRYYLSFFGQANSRLRSSAQTETLADLTVEMGNFRAAWDWAIQHGEFALIEQSLRTFWVLYDTRGWFAQGFDTLLRAVEALEAAHGRLPRDRTHALALAHLLSTAGWLAYRMANYEQAQAMLERSAETVRPLDEPRVLVESISRLGMLMEMTGNYAKASDCYSEGLQISTAIGDRWYAALCRTCANALAVTAHMADKPEDAYVGLQSAVAEWRLIGDRRMTAFGLRLLSYSAFALERYDEVRAALEESVALNSSVGDRWGLGSAFRGLGIVAQALGQHQEAAVMFGRSLDTFTELGASWWVARVLADTSRSVFAQGNLAEARRLWRESLRIATEIHATPVVLEALASFANLLASSVDRDHTLELLWIVLSHPACLQETKNRAGRLWDELTSQLSSTELDEIRALASGKALEAVVQELLN
jgi:predicted ATPase/DNA-binding XRE family transcriptional regulator